MLRIAICDDDKILVTQIEEMLNRYLDKKMIDRYIEIFYDGASLERIYEKGDRFDIIYLDIEMSGKNGIEAAKSIRRLDRDVLLIYVSSYETYFMQLFEVEPFRFIKKPIKETEFEEVIDFAYERIVEEDAYFEYKYNKTVATVYKGNIIKNLIMDCQSYTKYRPNETTGGIFVSWRRKEELPTGA